MLEKNRDSGKQLEVGVHDIISGMGYQPYGAPVDSRAFSRGWTAHDRDSNSGGEVDVLAFAEDKRAWLKLSKLCELRLPSQFESPELEGPHVLAAACKLSVRTAYHSLGDAV